MKENMLLHVKPPFTFGIQNKNYTIAEKEIPSLKSIASFRGLKLNSNSEKFIRLPIKNSPKLFHTCTFHALIELCDTFSLFHFFPPHSTHLINDKQQKKLRGKSLSLKCIQRTISAQIFRKFFIREKEKGRGGKFPQH
jgi:hypothetical protein